MYNWTLSKYGLYNFEEEVVFEDTDPDKVADKAIELSNEGNEVIGIWTYRMEAWENGERRYGYRFFNNGAEFTQGIKDSIRSS